MNKVGQISVKKTLYDDSFLNSRLEINMSGKDIDHIIVNTLRRICLTNIPVYIYNKFDFVENTSIFNNNYIKLRFRNIPVLGIESSSPFYEVNIKTKENNEEDESMLNIDDISLETTYDVSSSNLKQLTLYLDKENKTKNIITVGTDDCKFYYKEKEIKSPYKINIPLIKLQDGQSIKMTAISEIGIEKMDAMYSPASVLYFTKNNDNNYNFIVESRGQLREDTIIKYGIENVLKQLNDLKTDINDLDNIKKQKGTIEINNYDHTMGNLLSHGLKKHKDVKYSGYAMPHLLEDKININFEITKGNIKTIIIEVIQYYIELFTELKDKKFI
jgi:DNA-directed RNA polymerase subunit L/DNA-directed RNA polymerase alpha subunit